MTGFLIYQGKTAVILAAFYMFYRLLLSKDTFHRLNRIVLLGTAALSFILPLCVITIRKVVTLPSMADAVTEGTVPETMAYVPESASPWWITVLTAIFVIGATIALAKSIISIVQVIGIIRAGEHKILDSGETLVITDSETAPFSWMKYIVLSREDNECGYPQILTHEKAHIALRHSWDILFTDLVTALQWFNPAIWMLKADLRAIHEFEADDAVLRSGANVKEYQYLLIRKAVGKSGYSVANSFNHSTLKQRITMMSNKKSSRKSVWKALYVIPLVGISLAATAETKVDYLYEDSLPIAAADTLDSKYSDNWHKVEIESAKSGSSKERSIFTQKNLTEGKIVVDKENSAFTLHYFDTDGKELQVRYTGVDFSKSISMLNGAIVNNEALQEAIGNDPEAVVIVTYVDNNRINAAVTTSGRYLKGTFDLKGMQAAPVIEIRTRQIDGSSTLVGPEEILFIVNGEKMPKGFDIGSINPESIESIEVLKESKAKEEFGEEIQDGVIKITLKK